MPFAYYSRLNKRDQAIYRRSASLTKVELGQTEVLRHHVEKLQIAYKKGDRNSIQHAAQAFSEVMLKQLRISVVAVRVLAVRPSTARSELHGLYERTEGRQPVIRVWMRTAVHKRIVSFRTFVRILVHELCHHLDYELYQLPDSFHTEGFFKRESSVVRQILIPKKGASSSPGEHVYSLPPSPLVPLLTGANT